VAVDFVARPGEIDTGDHGYIEGQPYWVTLEKWDPESIDSPERYWPYERGSGADRIPGPHLTLAQPDPKGDA
jgi:hypothetical protein